jgi:hypothetical protein
MGQNIGNIKTVDIMFIGLIILLLFAYSFVSYKKEQNENLKKKNKKSIKEILQEDEEKQREKEADDEEFDEEEKEINRVRGRISFYESDKYQDLFKTLPWEDVDIDDDGCPIKTIDAYQIHDTGNLRRKTKMTIW